MTFELMVCPHDTASNPDRWFRFIQYLGQKLDTQFHFEMSLDFTDFRDNIGKADIAYANPSDTLNLIDDGLEAVVRPSNLYDEVVFLANTEIANPTLESLNGQTLVSVEKLQPTKLAMHILQEKGITPAGITDSESWTSVISTIWRGEAQYGLIYKDTYTELSDQGKSMVNAFYTSDEQVNFHNILIGRNAAAQKDTFVQLLLDMHTDATGKEVLEELHVEQWLPTTPDDIERIRRIMGSY
jgi:ABC-type phosphate/phosphonate transport system substrate-binding protein